MKKLIFSIISLLFCGCVHAQNVLLDTVNLSRQPIFRSLEEALKTPMKVYRLNFGGQWFDRITKRNSTIKKFANLKTK